jgi:threonine 3-dehydrogenase
MRALVKERPEPGLSLLEIECPRLEHADDVLLKIVYCAICVGETKVYDWNEWAASDATIQLPTVLGHEVAAEVVDVGPEVRGFRPGDRVTVDPLIHCGVCYQCRKGFTNMCESREIYGKRRGAFAEFAVLPARTLCKLPARVSMEEAALLENLGVAVRAVEVEAHDPGDTAVVIGCGPIGVMAAQAMLAAGMNVVITDRSQTRLDIAAGACAVRPVNVDREDPVQVVREMTHGRGADFVIEAAATQAAFDQAFDLVRTTGAVVTIGTFNQPVSFNPFFRMTRREVRLLSTMGRTWETWRRMVQLLEHDKLNLTPLISHILPLAEYRAGFELVKAGDCMKILLQP